MGGYMVYILFNSRSNRGKAVKKAERLEKKLSKNEKCKRINLLDIVGKEKEFSKTLSKEDSLILVGGDGTIHQFLNRIYPLYIPYKVFIFASGRGNDLSRDYKKKKLFEITHLVNDLPKLVVNDRDPYVFINGLGMGVDSCVCDEQNKNGTKGIKESYFKIALRVFKNFKPYTIDLVVDQVSYHFEKVWFFVCNNGRYFGGGMKITPMAVREDEVLDICVVHNIKLRTLLFIFPLVFLGWHTRIRKKNVTFLKGRKITIIPQGCQILQKDGEVTYGVSKLEINR